MKKIVKYGECLICNKSTGIHLFYYGFFGSEYDKTKWCYLCYECRNSFLTASNSSNRNKLIEMEEKITNKIKIKKI